MLMHKNEDDSKWDKFCTAHKITPEKDEGESNPDVTEAEAEEMAKKYGAEFMTSTITK